MGQRLLLTAMELNDTSRDVGVTGLNYFVYSQLSYRSEHSCSWSEEVRSTSIGTALLFLDSEKLHYHDASPVQQQTLRLRLPSRAGNGTGKVRRAA